jgi:hypothetical protein
MRLIIALIAAFALGVASGDAARSGRWIYAGFFGVASFVSAFAAFSA